MLRRILAIFHARNLEFLRDRGTLSWNLVLPIALMFGLSFIFGAGERPEYTIGVFQQGAAIESAVHPFLQTRYVEFVPLSDLDEARRKVARHQLDLLVQFEPRARYWVNPDSPRGYFAERLLRASVPGIDKAEIPGEAVRYVDWVLPGILGMNMMFSCLFGVGYVIVRYRKNGFLKRLRATPLNALEFILAQVASRLVLIIAVTVLMFTGLSFLLDIGTQGSPLTLLAIAVMGAVSMISLGLVVAARVTSDELAAGLLNFVSWPMMLLSGVWFSLEGAAPWVRRVAEMFPLTHVLDAARAVMIDDATFLQVAPQLAVLVVMSAVFLALAARLFRWRPQ